MPSINIGWFVFLGIWSISLGEVIGGNPSSFAWKSAVFFLAVALVITVKTYYRYRRELRFLREFHHLSQTMDELRHLNSQSPFHHILEAIVKIVGFDRAVLFLKDSESHELRAVYGFPLEESIRKQLIIPRDSKPSIAWKVMESREPLIVSSPQKDPETNPLFLNLLKSSVIALAPIIRRGEALGLLMVDRHESHLPLSDEDILQLQVLADQVGVALHNLSLHEEISHKASQLETQNSRLQQELQLAKFVQDGVLPRTSPQWDGLSISAFMRAARFIGGDFFSYLDGCRQGRKKCGKPHCDSCPNYMRGILIGDVTGKGIPAALVMAVVHCLFQEKVFYFSDPAEIMTEANLSLKTYLGAESRFNSSAFLGFCLPLEKKFIYANAGHDFPFFYSARTKQFFSLESTGTLLGLFRESGFTTRELQYEPGDWFFFFTDGLIEHLEKKMNYEDGYEALQEILKNISAQNSTEFLAELNAILKFSAEEEVTDDITMIMMVVET